MVVRVRVPLAALSIQARITLINTAFSETVKSVPNITRGLFYQLTIDGNIHQFQVLDGIASEGFHRGLVLHIDIVEGEIAQLVVLAATHVEESATIHTDVVEANIITR